VIASPEAGLTAAAHKGSISKLDFWNETGKGREQLLTEVFRLLEEEGWNYSSDTGWKDWDIQIYCNQFWSISVRSVTEYHGGPKCLTRVRLLYHAVATTYLINALILAFLLYRAAFTQYSDSWLWAIYGVLLVFFALRARRLKRRVADLIIHAAQSCELMRVFGAASKPAPK
jgi:hypothetical protein